MRRGRFWSNIGPGAVIAAAFIGPGTVTTATLAGAEHVGFPLIVKPVAGAGSADTYRVDDRDQLTRALQALARVPEIVTIVGQLQRDAHALETELGRFRHGDDDRLAVDDAQLVEEGSDADRATHRPA